MKNDFPTRSLLDRFAQNESGAAFRELVQEHSGLVLGTAIRRLNGDRAGAEEVAQEVFCLLARKAKSLKPTISLAGWLYRQTCRLSSNRLRQDTRRSRREEYAAELMKTNPYPESSELLGALDDALLALPKAAREVIALRYLDGLSYRALATQTGLSEEAARKRVTRGVEQLKNILQRRGVTASATVLATTLSGLPTGKASAEVCASWTSKALGQTVPAGVTGMLSLGAALTGALSVVAGTVLVSYQEKASPSPGLPSSLVTSSRPTRVDPLASFLQSTASTMSQDYLIEALKNLKHEPPHLFTDMKREVLLEQIANEDIPEFVTNSLDLLSGRNQVACYNHLIERWLTTAPEAAMDFLLSDQLLARLSVRTSLDRRARDWMEQSPQDVVSWLRKRWSHPKLTGSDRVNEIWSCHDQIYRCPNMGVKLLRHVLKELNQQSGPSAVLHAIAHFDQSTQEQVWESLTFIPDHIPPDPEFANHLLQLPDSPGYRRAKQSFWRSVKRRGLRSLAATHVHQAQRETFAPSGFFRNPPVQEDDRVDFETFLNQLDVSERFKVQLALLDKPGDHAMALTAGIDAGLSEREIFEEMARSYLVAAMPQYRSDAALIQWLHDHAYEFDLTAEIDERLARHNDFSRGTIQTNRYGNRFMLQIFKDDLIAAREDFDQLQRDDPSYIEYFLTQSPMPDSLREEFQTLVQAQRK